MIIIKDQEQQGDAKKLKNSFVVFKNKDQAKIAADHIQNLLNLQDESKANEQKTETKTQNQQNDFKTTIFISNLPLVLNEQELRKHFKDNQSIENVHIVRDQDTFIGKGIGFIKYSNESEMLKAIEDYDQSIFKGRIIKVKKAEEAHNKEKKIKKQKKKRDQKYVDKQNLKEQKEIQKLSQFVENARKSIKGNGYNEDVRNFLLTQIDYGGQQDCSKVQERKAQGLRGDG